VAKTKLESEKRATTGQITVKQMPKYEELQLAHDAYLSEDTIELAQAESSPYLDSGILAD